MSLLSAARLTKLKNWPLLPNNWHYLSAAVLTVINKPAEIPVLYNYAVAEAPASSQAQLTAQFRESIFKTAALIGLPRVINALTELKNVTPPDLRATKLLREDKLDYSKEGKELFGQVYGKITTRLHTQLAAAYPDLDWFVTNFEYGPLLAHTSVLDAKQTSFVIVSSLIPQDVNPQLKGHLKGALNNGATKEEVNSLRAMVLEMSTWYGTAYPNEVSKL